MRAPEASACPPTSKDAPRNLSSAKAPLQGAKHRQGLCRNIGGVVFERDLQFETGPVGGYYGQTLAGAGIEGRSRSRATSPPKPHRPRSGAAIYRPWPPVSGQRLFQVAALEKRVGEMATVRP